MVVWREKCEDNGVSFASSPSPPPKSILTIHTTPALKLKRWISFPSSASPKQTLSRFDFTTTNAINPTQNRAWILSDTFCAASLRARMRSRSRDLFDSSGEGEEGTRRYAPPEDMPWLWLRDEKGLQQYQAKDERNDDIQYWLNWSVKSRRKLWIFVWLTLAFCL